MMKIQSKIVCLLNQNKKLIEFPFGSLGKEDKFSGKEDNREQSSNEGEYGDLSNG